MEGFVNHKLEKWDWGLSSRILLLPTKNEMKPMTLVEKFANTTRKRKMINMSAVPLEQHHWSTVVGQLTN